MSLGNRLRRNGFTTATLVLLLAWVPAPASAGDEKPPCDDHTDDTRWTCSGASCAQWDTIGVSINADDEDEVVEATGSCNSSEAHCDGVDSCSNRAPTPAAAAAPWSCTFSSEDAWYFPNNGFHYNCYAVPGSAPSAKVVCDRLEASGVGDCAGVVSLETVEEIVGGLVGTSSTVPLRFADVWEPGARVQKLVEVGPAGVVGFQCDAAGCAPLTPACVALGVGLRCSV